MSSFWGPLQKCDFDQEERVREKFIRFTANRYLESAEGVYDKEEFRIGIPEWFKDEVLEGDHLDLIWDRDNGNY